VTPFKALSLERQKEAFPQITAAFEATKDAGRLQFEAEIHALGLSRGQIKEIAA
jgi:hypothetical protein